MDHLLPAFKFTRFGIGLDGKLLEKMIVRLPDIPSILLGPLGFPPNGE